MLTALSLKNFIFIDEVHLDFTSGMTALTGETGAGKSILCDALWLALGAPSDKSMIQLGKDACHLEACFSLVNAPRVEKWLQEKGYLQTSHTLNKASCYIKRVISQKGRGQAWINQKPCKITDLRWLKKHLVARHSQHDQQKLLTHDYQRECLDLYGGYSHLLESVEVLYHEHQSLQKQKENLVAAIKQQEDRLAILEYQLEELEKAHVKPNELDNLMQKQRQLSSASEVIQEGQRAIAILNEGEPVHLMGLLQTVQQTIQKIASEHDS